MNAFDLMDEQAVEKHFPMVYRDVLPVAVEKITEQGPPPRAEIQPIGISDSDPLRPDEIAAEGVSELLWRKLVSIERKVDLLMEMLLQSNRSPAEWVDMPVVLNERGIRMWMQPVLKKQDRLRLRIRIPVSPPTYILVSGDVFRVCPDTNGGWDVVLRWNEMDDTVLRLIRFYAMNRQREVIRKRKEEFERRSS